MRTFTFSAFRASKLTKAVHARCTGALLEDEGERLASAACWPVARLRCQEVRRATTALTTSCVVAWAGSAASPVRLHKKVNLLLPFYPECIWAWHILETYLERSVKYLPAHLDYSLGHPFVTVLVRTFCTMTSLLPHGLLGPPAAQPHALVHSRRRPSLLAACRRRPRRTTS